MRSIPINCTTIYRWLYTTTAPTGAVGQSAIGPYSRKQSVNHYVAKGYKVKAELQGLQPSLISDTGMEWVTIKTVELKNQ